MFWELGGGGARVTTVQTLSGFRRALGFASATAVGKGKKNGHADPHVSEALYFEKIL